MAHFLIYRDLNTYKIGILQLWRDIIINVLWTVKRWYNKIKIKTDMVTQTMEAQRSSRVYWFSTSVYCGMSGQYIARSLDFAPYLRFQVETHINDGTPSTEDGQLYQPCYWNCKILCFGGCNFLPFHSHDIVQ